MGIGLACALAYGRCGARTILTHRWGSADEEELRRRFADAGAPEPMIVEADVSNDDDTQRLMAAIAERCAAVDVFVSNVSFALRAKGLEDYSRRALQQSLDYSSWPMVAYTMAMHRVLGRYPRYVIGISSDGPDNFFQNYDFVAMSKAVLETMCRYLAYRLREHGTRVNVVRSRLVRTEAFDSTFGSEFHAYLESLGGFEDCYTEPEELGKAVLALGSGLLDAMTGQVVMVDRGFEFFDNLMGIGDRARARGLKFRPVEGED